MKNSIGCIHFVVVSLQHSLQSNPLKISRLADKLTVGLAEIAA